MGHTLGVSKSLSDGMNSTGFLVLCSLIVHMEITRCDAKHVYICENECISG